MDVKLATVHLGLWLWLTVEVGLQLNEIIFWVYLTHLCPVREISSGHLELPPQLLPHNCLLTVTPSASSDCEITLSNQHIIVKSRMRIKYTVVYLHCLCHLSIFSDISPESKGNGGESIYGPTFEGMTHINSPRHRQYYHKNALCMRFILVNILLLSVTCATSPSRWELCRVPFQTWHPRNGQ